MGAFLGQIRMAQTNGATCERTPEGGMRCADGTYLPPGCQPGDPATVQAAKPGTPIWPWIVGAGALAAGAAVALSGPRRALGATLEDVYPAVAADLRAIAGKITGERAADAWNFSQMQAALKKKYDLLFQQKAAQENLQKEEKLWEQAHRNAEALQAATAEVDRLERELAEANAKVDEYRGYVDANAALVLRYRENADALIARLPVEYQGEARTIIDPCYKAPAAMKGGAYLGQVGLLNQVPGGYGVEFGWNRPQNRRNGTQTAPKPSRSFTMPPWTPYMGQTIVATSPPAEPSAMPPADLKSVAGNYGLSVGLGAVIGAALHLAVPSLRRTRKEALSMMGFSTGVSVLGYLLNLAFGEKPFFSSMIRIGGLFTGSAAMDAAFPAPKQVCVPISEAPKLAGWRR